MNRYEKAHRYLWNKLPNWKRVAIQEDRAAGKDSSILDEFTKAVIQLAEDPKAVIDSPTDASALDKIIQLTPIE